jgi:membrane-bound lytic murein transglycosylase B
MASALLEQNADLLSRIEQRYGVDRQALVSVWGMESNFGTFQGNKSVIRSLATLAYEGRRPEFAQSQLIAALQDHPGRRYFSPKNARLVGRRHGPDPVHPHHL